MLCNNNDNTEKNECKLKVNCDRLHKSSYFQELANWFSSKNECMSNECKENSIKNINLHVFQNGEQKCYVTINGQAKNVGKNKSEIALSSPSSCYRI